MRQREQLLNYDDAEKSYARRRRLIRMLTMGAFALDALRNMMIPQDATAEYYPARQYSISAGSGYGLVGDTPTVTELLGFNENGDRVTRATASASINVIRVNSPQSGMDTRSMYDAWKRTVIEEASPSQPPIIYAQSMGGATLADFLRYYKAEGAPFGKIEKVILDGAVSGSESVRKPIEICGFLDICNVIGMNTGPFLSDIIMGAKDFMDDLAPTERPPLGPTALGAQLSFIAHAEELEPDEFHGMVSELVFFDNPEDEVVNTGISGQQWAAALGLEPDNITRLETYGPHAAGYSTGDFRTATDNPDRRYVCVDPTKCSTANVGHS